MSEKPIVPEAIADALQRHGVQFVLGQSVPTKLVLACEDRGIKQVGYRQENMGGIIADGFARVSGRIPVIVSQNGPGAALLIPPFAEAKTVGIRIVAIVQEVDRNNIGKNAFQEFDHQALFAPVTKWYRRLETTEDIDLHVDAAFYAAGSGRPGPAVLMLPVDLHEKPAGRSRHRRFSISEWPTDRPVADINQLEKAAQLIEQAKAPVILAGGGVHASRASLELTRLQDLASLPVLTTSMGKGAVSESNSLSAGPLGVLTGPGSLGHYTRPLISEADVVLLIGTRTNEDGTNKWSLIDPNATTIHIDIDPQEVGRNYESVRLVGDARATINKFSNLLAINDKLDKRRSNRKMIEELVTDAWNSFEKDRISLLSEPREYLRPEEIMLEVQPYLNGSTSVVADASYSSNWVVGQLRTSNLDTRVVTPRGLAGLGWGLPLAMGVKLGSPDKRVIAVVGDGEFAHAWSEMETAVRSNIPVTIIVLNNGVLGYQKDAETVKFGRDTSVTHFGPIDHSLVASACGAKGVRVSTRDELRDALKVALTSVTLTLIDVRTDPGAHPPISLYDGTLDNIRDGVIVRVAA